MRSKIINNFVFGLLFFALLCTQVWADFSALPIKVMVQKDETVDFSPVFRLTDTIGKTLVLSTTVAAQNGSVTILPDIALYGSLSIPGFRYVPNSNFTGVDSFSWSIGDGSSTSSSICRIKVHPPEPGNMVVVLYVNDLLLPQINTEVNRLKDDLNNEGYSAKIKTWEDSKVRDYYEDFRNSIIAEYETLDNFLAGVILIGKMPLDIIAGKMNDITLWNMATWRGDVDSLTFGLQKRNARHIWASRIYAIAPSYGDEVTLTKRTLQANHDYRTGKKRLPNTMLLYGGRSNDPDYIGELRDVWTDEFYFGAGGKSSSFPNLPSNNLTPYEWGGDFANALPYGWLRNNDCLMETFSPIRTVVNAICFQGGLGDFVNLHLLPRNGSCVLSISKVDYKESPTLVNYKSYLKGYEIKMKALLKSGSRWGRAWLQSNMVIDEQAFYGDFSVKPLMSPSNELPVIDTIIADKISGVAPLIVNFSCSAHDSDNGSIDFIEWFPLDYDLGRAEPAVSGIGKTTLTYTYTKPYHYKARVNAMDNYKAWSYKYKDIFVAPGANDTIRVRCGIPPVNSYYPKHEARWEYTDTTGKLWYHDQLYASGTWGSDTIYSNYTKKQLRDWKPNPLPSSETTFASMIWDSTKIGYKIPLIKGKYKIKIGFADYSRKAFVVDVVLNSGVWKTGLCPDQLVGSIKLITIDTIIDFEGGEFEFQIMKNQTSQTPVFMNNFEIEPMNSSVIEGAKISLPSVFSMQASPNPFSGSSKISLNIPKSQTGFSLRIYDLKGRLVRSIAQGNISAGYHSIRLDNGSDSKLNFVSGIYFCCIKSKEYKKTLKLIKLR